ncbi:e3a9f18b-f9ec-4f8f-a540-32037256c216 [Sclerotinia trifoliorum]|uniref:E3a9f18b-f9ec-4f8f-a540-32037256c216 n=1 Tax=Sclerotinia trifoliorum TaxID=28548 RepID=A0A8H2W084_9HELO|nr:e3a9f18b-f9ec-4f8f-a540-32037256c216 [Sclerotinia trifoliorum]
MASISRNVAQQFEVEFEKGKEAEQPIFQEQHEEPTENEVGPNVVDFDGPDDSANPLNWSLHYKWFMVVVLSLTEIMVCQSRNHYRGSRSTTNPSRLS